MTEHSGPPRGQGHSGLDAWVVSADTLRGVFCENADKIALTQLPVVENRLHTSIKLTSRSCGVTYGFKSFGKYCYNAPV